MNVPKFTSRRVCLAITAVFGVTSSLVCFATDAETLAQLQGQWAHANYQAQGEAQEKAFETLLHDVQAAVDTAPDSAELLVWSGIIKSSCAGARGGLGALKLAKSARVDLEKALEIDPDVLQGSAYTSLGALYYKVPGWPVGFGDDDKAETLLKQALDRNPDGIDPNYFYGDFLLDQKRYKEAETALLRAQAAPPRADRKLADEGRQREIGVDLEKVRKHLDG